MKAISKTAAKAAAVVGLLAFGFAFFRQRSLLLHQSPGGSQTRMILYVVLSSLSFILLLVFFASGFKKYLSKSMERWMIQGGQPTEPVAELEEAQRLRSSGQALEAITALREYLQANPYEMHVMSRIAEIYRYDLKNDLAAALEYEEMLKHQLPDDQWAWAALHLAKLYGRLNELEKSVALLERLDSAYAHTIAGRRAKKALQQVRDPDAPGAQDDSEQEDLAG